MTYVVETAGIEPTSSGLQPDAKPSQLSLLLGERRVTIPLPSAPQTDALPIELHSPFGGDGGYRTHSSGFSVQRNHLICHVSNFWVSYGIRTRTLAFTEPDARLATLR